MLRLYHPITGIEMEWHAPIPQDMVELIDAMRADFEAHRTILTGYDKADCSAVAYAERRGGL